MVDVDSQDLTASLATAASPGSDRARSFLSNRPGGAGFQSKRPKKAPAAAGPLDAVSADLTTTLAAWEAQSVRLYGDAPPAAYLNITVVAATGLAKIVTEPFWVASVAGVAAATATATPLKSGVLQAPAGAPSWDNAPLELAVHDVTADLYLLLCEASGTSAGRACVGRAVVPLVELLPKVPVGMQPPAKTL